MHKVWIVGISVYEGFVVKVICSSAEKAEKMRKQLDSEGGWCHEIEERFMDIPEW